MYFNLWLFKVLGMMQVALDPTFEFAWPIGITGKLEKPVTRTVYVQVCKKHNEDTQ